jgi:hypothetical protein
VLLVLAARAHAVRLFVFRGDPDEPTEPEAGVWVFGPLDAHEAVLAVGAYDLEPSRTPAVRHVALRDQTYGGKRFVLDGRFVHPVDPHPVVGRSDHHCVVPELDRDAHGQGV